MNQKEIIEQLELIPHPEGGYFREVYRSGAEPMRSKGATDEDGAVFKFDDGDQRNLLTSIYWMLTEQSPIGWWCKNQSDHVHYHHLGATIEYLVIDENGAMCKHQLGADIRNGDVPQLVVPGGCWKTALKKKGEFALIGEAVAPGFDFRDFQFATSKVFKQLFPERFNELSPYIKDHTEFDVNEIY